MSDALRQVLRPPPDRAELPAFAGGWAGGEPFLAYAGDDAAVDWSDDLEALHEESTRGHFIDVWTRRSALEAIAPSIRPGAVVADIGCSTGYLLEDLRARQPAAVLIGADLVAAGLRKAHQNVPEAALVLADATRLPLENASVDALASINVLEHVPDDEASLAEMRRILRPGALAAIVVPAAPTLYDYYDRMLGHERRYARGELARKARAAGFDVVSDAHLGWTLYPAFWAKKNSTPPPSQPFAAGARAAGHRRHHEHRALPHRTRRHVARARRPERRPARSVRDPRPRGPPTPCLVVASKWPKRLPAAHARAGARA